MNTDLIKIISSISLIVFSAALFYTAHGTFKRIDRMDELTGEVKIISERVENSTLNLEKFLNKAEEKMPGLLKDSGKGLIDGIRNGFGKEK